MAGAWRTIMVVVLALVGVGVLVGLVLTLAARTPNVTMRWNVNATATMS